MCVDLDVVVWQRVGREEPDDRAGLEQLLRDDAVQEGLAVLEESACFRALLRVVQDLGVATLHLPGVEKERPVYVRAYLLQREVIKRLDPEEVRLGRGVPIPLYLLAVGSRLFEGGELDAGPASGVLLAHQVLDHTHGPRGVLHVDRGVLVVWSDLDRRVRLRGGCPADEQRYRKALALHLLSVVHHLPEIYDLEVVALQNDTDDVLPDVVHVALHGRQHDRALGLLVIALLRLDVRNQVSNGPLHHARALDHLRQEHPARPKKVPDHVHPLHEGTLDHLYRALVLVACLLDVVLDELGDALDQSVLDAFLHRPRAPLQGLLRLVRAAVAVLLGQLQQTLGRVITAVQYHILDGLAQLLVYLIVDRELSGVHDAHREPGVYGVVEEDGVDRFAHRVVTAEREGDV